MLMPLQMAVWALAQGLESDWDHQALILVPVQVQGQNKAHMRRNNSTCTSRSMKLVGEDTTQHIAFFVDMQHIHYTNSSHTSDPMELEASDTKPSTQQQKLSRSTS